MQKIFGGIMTIGIIAITAGCGGAPTMNLAGDGGCGGKACGSVRLIVNGSKSFDPTIEYARIQTYRVSVAGPGIEGELVSEFSGDATEGVIEGVPAGGDRIVTVQALNDNRVRVREGEAEGVSIDGGATADVEVTLESVPLFINLAEGAIVENTRLVFHIFSESPDPVVVEDAADTAPKTLLDASTNIPEVALDVATGVGRLAPLQLPPGVHTFTVRNSITNRANTVQVTLLDGSLRTPAPFIAASSVARASDQPVRRVGQAIARPTVRGMAPVGVYPQLITTSE